MFYHIDLVLTACYFSVVYKQSEYVHFDIPECLQKVYTEAMQEVHIDNKLGLSGANLKFTSGWDYLELFYLH